MLVGFATSDDAAVYRINETQAIVTTVDFITPPVDDPYWFGQIAAANSISDVYAMGARPITALNLVMFPSKQLDMGILKEILRGGNDKVMEAGAVLAGGHTVDDEEPKYGLSVTGLIDPKRVISNASARVGDALVLTKPLGSGVLFNAVRSKRLVLRDIEREILPSVAALNNTAMEVALERSYSLNACTDVTGFGICGHSFEMARGSGLRVELNYAALPFYEYAQEMYRKGETTGSNQDNRDLMAGHLEILPHLVKEQEELLFDPQTSGGLLLSLPESQAEELVEALRLKGVHAVRIGRVVEGAGVAVV